MISSVHVLGAAKVVTPSQQKRLETRITTGRFMAPEKTKKKA